MEKDGRTVAKPSLGFGSLPVELSASNDCHSLSSNIHHLPLLAFLHSHQIHSEQGTPVRGFKNDSFDGLPLFLAVKASRGADLLCPAAKSWIGNLDADEKKRR